MQALIVDDNDLLRETLLAILESLGLTVTQAGDGNEAISRIKEAAEPFDLIICDLQMPNRDGVQLLRELGDQQVKAGIVIMSGRDPTILAAATEIGRRHALNIVGDLKKPFTRAQIRELLASPALAQARTAPPKRSEINEADILRGLAADEFFVVFQPKVECTTYALAGTEALIRWRHPVQGLIPPGDFIALSEESTAIDELTEFMLRKTLEFCAEMPPEAGYFPVAINLSTSSLSRLDFPDRLHRVVTASNIDPSLIIFEVTEGRLAENLSALIESSTRLRLMGFKLAIDDFGTGYSTLEQLGRLPVSELKIDRAFVAGAPDNERVRHILEASLTLGTGLGLQCVCEGVETQAEWDLIRGLGNHVAQGYFIARPMPAAALAGWAEEWAKRPRPP